MKGFLALSLLLCLFPFVVGAQTEESASRTEEWVNTGRFGAEDEEENSSSESAGYYGHWLYLGARLGPSLRFYTPAGDTPYTGGDTLGIALDTAVFATLQIFHRLSVQGEAVFTWDKAASWDYMGPTVNEIDRYTREYTSLSLSFPLTVKWNFYPGRFRISPFAGVYALVPLGKMGVASSLANASESRAYRFSLPLGFLGGLAAGFKLGPGMVVGDLRYAADLGKPKLRDGDMASYLRSMVTLSFGYEWAFFTKKGGSRE